MDEAGNLLVGDIDALSDRVDRLLEEMSQYKKVYTQSQDKLCRSVNRIGELQVKLCQEPENVADQSSKLARLRRDLLDRDSVLTQLRFKLSNLTAERELAIQDHRTLRDRMTSLVTGDLVPISTPMADRSHLWAANPSDLSLTNRKRPRDAVSSQAQTIPTKSQPILDLHPQSKPIGESGRSSEPKTRQDLAIDRPARKSGKSRLRRSASPVSEDEECAEVEDLNLAALSRSRSFSRRKQPRARSQRSAGSSPSPTVVDFPGKSVVATTSRLDSPRQSFK